MDSDYKTIVQTNNRIIKAYERKMAGDYARLLKDLKVSVARAYEEYSKAGNLTYTELQRYGRIKQLYAELDTVTSINTAPVYVKMKLGIADVADKSYSLSLDAIGAAVGREITRQLSASEIMEILDTPVDGWSWEQRQLLRQTDLGNRIKRSVTRDMMKGSAYGDTAGNLNAVITKDYIKTKQVMEDLGHSVQSESITKSMRDASEENNIQVTKVWVTAGDLVVRDAHAALDGQEVNADEMFVIPSGDYAGYKADGPGLFYEPALDYGCRCWVVAGVRSKE